MGGNKKEGQKRQKRYEAQDEKEANESKGAKELKDPKEAKGLWRSPKGDTYHRKKMQYLILWKQSIQFTVDSTVEYKCIN